jgi:hypothetical protein
MTGTGARGKAYGAGSELSAGGKLLLALLLIALD